jgi:hypothetical protein
MAHDILSPGVSVQVKDTTSFTAATQGTVSATAGFAEKGPVGEPTLILSKEDYVNTFGRPISDNPFMGMFADKFLEQSVGWFTRVAKEKDYEKVCGTVDPSLDFTSVTSPEFWVKLEDFPIPNNGIYKVQMTGGSEFSDLQAMIDDMNTAFEAVTLPDGETPLSSYITAIEDEEDSGKICIKSDFYMNVKITVLESEDATNNVVGTSGTGHIGIEDGASSEDVGAISRAFYRLPVEEESSTNASISSSSQITQEDLNEISAFNRINLKVDGSSSDPYKEYEDVNIRPSSGSAATFPKVGADNTPSTDADLSTSDFEISLSGFYDLLSGDADGDVNSTFTITTTLDGTGTAFTVDDLVTDLNDQLNGVTTPGGTLDQYIQFEKFETDKIRLVNGTEGLANFGSQVTVEIANGTSGDIVDLGYTGSSVSEFGEDATWTLEDVASRIDNQISEIKVSGSNGVLTLESNTVGGTSFIEINEAATTEDSAVSLLNFMDGDSATGSIATNEGIINFVAKDAGSFGNNLKVRTYTTTNPITGNDRYNLEVFDGDESVEIFNNISWTNESSDNFIKKMLEESDYIAVDFGVTVQYPEQDTGDVPTAPAPNSNKNGNPEYWELSGGNDGVPDDADSIDSLIVNALDEYLDTEQFIIDVVLAPGFVGTPVVNKLQLLGEARRDCVVLVDPPPFLDWKQIIDWHNGSYDMGSETSVSLSSAYTIATWGWQRDFDPYNENYIDLPPSIYEAVAIARTQSNYELWEAPAGQARGVVNSISSYTKPNQAQREYLYNDVDPACINPIVQFPNKGTLIYGQKTCLRQTKAMNRINVVRLVNHIKRNVENIGDKYIFELTNASTWAEVDRELRNFLGNIQERGGLTTYGVAFDASTNTPERRDQGIMYGKIFIQPVRVAERIFIDLTIQRTGAEAAV